VNQRIANVLNPVLVIFARKIVRTYIGRWSVDHNRELVRRTYPIGWRLARRAEWEGVPEGATEMDRFIASHKGEIEAKREGTRH
jgi:hypothetical protein